MRALRAVEPDGLRIHDSDRIREYVSGGDGCCVSGHEAGEESIGLVWHYVLDRHAGLVEGRLDNGVILVGTLANIA